MTDDEIKNLANQSGADSAGLNVESASVLAMFKRFAKSIESRTWTDTKARWYQAGVEAEREACAQVCEQIGGQIGVFGANAVRARGE